MRRPARADLPDERTVYFYPTSCKRRGLRANGPPVSQSSLASHSELPLTFGLGRATAVDSIRVTWPSGIVDAVSDAQADQAITRGR